VTIFIRLFFLLPLCAWLIGFASQARSQTLELRDAHAVVKVQDETIEKQVTLPYYWDRLHKGLPGYATFDIPFELTTQPNIPYGLYLPKLGNAYEIWLNGVMIQRNGDMAQFNHSDYAKVPRFVVIAPNELRDSNLIRVIIRADIGRRAGLSNFILGPYEDVYPLYLSDYRWLEIGSMLVMMLSFLVGLIALTLWATQVDTTPGSTSRRDPLYLLAALAELCWTVGVSNFITEKDILTWPWSGIVIFLTTPAWATCMTLFCVEIAGWGQLNAAKWFQRWLVFLLVTCFAGAVAQLKFGNTMLFTLWYLTFGVTYLAFGGFFTFKTRRTSSLPHKLVAIALLTNVVVGVYDIYVLRLSSEYTAYTFLRYSSVLFGATLFYIVISRFRSVSGQARDLMDNMVTQVAQKEYELALSYQQQEKLAREQERTLERTRILRDMHDGVGAHISTAIRQLQSGKASADTVLNTMRDSLDQLKLSVDAMNFPKGDVTALLASLRYRLEPRIVDSNIELQWNVVQVAPLTRLDTNDMRQVQFMIFECISNVLQHANASILRIELASENTGSIRLRVSDNGCGFDLAQLPARALSSLRDRATLIGATLDVVSQPSGTTVEILLPA